MQEQFVIHPNLPESTVSCAILSGQKTELVRELHRCGVRVISTSGLPSVSGSERDHADMCLCHIGGQEIMVSCNLPSEIRQALCMEGFRLTETLTPVIAPRPLLNVCLLGKLALCHRNKTESLLLDFLSAHRYTIVHTNQAYARCSTAILGPKAVITADPGIAQICIRNGIDVLPISSGHIMLEGYHYGFIGGCCGLLSRDILAFSGNIKKHPDYDNIKAFAGNYHISLLSLSDKPLYDIGGILPLKVVSESA